MSITTDNPLMAMSTVFESVCLVAENSQMVQSVVKYVSPEKEFRKQYSFEERYAEAHRVMHKYPNRIPVICERDQRDSNLPPDNKIKFLIPLDMTVGQFVYVIRQRVKLPPETAIFMFITKEKKDGSVISILAPTSQVFDNVYFDCKDRDGFLYVKISGEHTFGFG